MIQTLFGSVEQEPSLLEKLKSGVERTRAGLVTALEDALQGKKEIDAGLLDDLESTILRLKEAAAHDPHMCGRLKFTVNRAKPGDAEIELLSPLREDTPVGKFLAKRGPGLHHIAVAVPDIDRAIADARAKGLEMIDQEPRIGLHGTRIAFVQPKSVGGVLTEFVET